MPLNGIKTQEISTLAVKNMCPSIQFTVIMLDFKLFKKLSGNEAGKLSRYPPAPSYIKKTWNPNAMALLDNREAESLASRVRFSYCSDMNMNGTYEKNHRTAAIRDAVLAVEGQIKT